MSSPEPGREPYGQEASGRPSYGAPYDQQQFGHGEAPYGQQSQAYGVPGQEARPPRNGVGVVALVVGILTILLSWTGFLGLFSGVGAAIGFGIIPIVLGVAAIVLGVVGMRRAGRGEATNRGVAIGGLVTGIVGLLLGLALTALAAFSAFGISQLPVNFGDTVRQATQCIQEQTARGVDQQTAQQTCQQQIQQQVQRQIESRQGGGGGY